MSKKALARHAKKFQKALKAHNMTKATHHNAWEIFHADGLDAALAYVTEVTRPIPSQEPIPCQIWGAEQIDSETIQQMKNATTLPIARKAALMPDAHLGYGLPIGGVLATENTVIPYAVGSDIACRMRISIFALDEHAIKKHRSRLKNVLLDQTRFGSGAAFDKDDLSQHAVLDHPDWNALPLLRQLKETAVSQLGSSGSGNHFVEWGVFETDMPVPELHVPQAGSYLALLSHSGSRAVGFKIADHYNRLAADLHPNLDKEVKHLAWLDMDSAEGQEYWLAMTLAGEFAAANHAVIHERIAHETGFAVLGSAENHHNFAWKEEIDGVEYIVHRKGATPADVGVMGIIPGSMGDAGYVVRGKGKPEALNSASHGAGRKMSRRAAKKAYSRGELLSYLKPRRVELLGGGTDETPHAYKSIERVMQAQADLVDIVGKFTPRIVRMADD